MTEQTTIAGQIDTKPVVCSLCGADGYSVVAEGQDYIYHGTTQKFRHVACSRCGHIYLNPQPAIAALPLMYPANYGTFSNRFRGGANLLGRVKTSVNLRRIAEVLADVPTGGRILDVGCGNGELLLVVRRSRPDIQAYGLDWHFPSETREALERGGITLIEAPLENAQLPPGSFDLILLLQLVEHLWDPAAGVARLAAALAEGGCLLIETPNTNGWDRRLFSGGAWGGYYFPRHLNLYNPESLERLMNGAGLQVSSKRNLPAPLIWIYSLQGAIQRRLGLRSRIAHWFGVRNLPLVGALALLDKLAVLIGAQTSNQQIVARRNPTAFPVLRVGSRRGGMT